METANTANTTDAFSEAHIDTVETPQGIPTQTEEKKLDKSDLVNVGIIMAGLGTAVGGIAYMLSGAPETPQKITVEQPPTIVQPVVPPKPKLEAPPPAPVIPLIKEEVKPIEVPPVEIEEEPLPPYAYPETRVEPKPTEPQTPIIIGKEIEVPPVKQTFTQKVKKIFTFKKKPATVATVSSEPWVKPFDRDKEENVQKEGKWKGYPLRLKWRTQKVEGSKNDITPYGYMDSW